jgi:hypothetical protein
LENNETFQLKQKIKTEFLATKYRTRVADFITHMAMKPLVKIDDYNEKWHRKNAEKKE